MSGSIAVRAQCTADARCRVSAQLLELSELADPARGWLGEDGALTVEALILPAAWTVRARVGIRGRTISADAPTFVAAAAQAVRHAQLDG